MNGTSLVAAAITAVLFLAGPLYGCVYNRQAANERMTVQMSSTAVTDEEREVLETFYDKVGPKLSERQQEIVEAYRALKEYMAVEHSGEQWKVALLEPAGPLNASGSSYETFHVNVSGSMEKYEVEQESSGKWRVIYDSTLKTGGNAEGRKSGEPEGLNFLPWPD